MTLVEVFKHPLIEMLLPASCEQLLFCKATHRLVVLPFRTPVLDLNSANAVIMSSSNHRSINSDPWSMHVACHQITLLSTVS